MKLDGNEAAFARPATVVGEYFAVPQEGLTKREYFAAMAMQGDLSTMKPGSITGDIGGLENLAIGWVQAADALIEALSKETE